MVKSWSAPGVDQGRGSELRSFSGSVIAEMNLADFFGFQGGLMIALNFVAAIKILHFVESDFHLRWDLEPALSSRDGQKTAKSGPRKFRLA